MSSHGVVPAFEQLPVLYQRWVEELLPAGISWEREATCLDCAMCSHHAPHLDRGIGFYNKATKCCTYFLDIPNFLAGRAVANDNPGAAALRSIIAKDGDMPGKASMRAVQPNALCGIWQQRNSVCSTWFCKHGRGTPGARFWQSVQGLFSSLGWGLSWWAITEVVDEPAEVLSIGEVRVNEANPMALRPDAWRHWKGSRISFCEACADRVERRSAREAIAIAGMDARLFQTQMGTRFQQRVTGEAADRLRTVPFSYLYQEAQRATLQALSCSEPVQAPAMLVPLLRFFHGRPTGEVLEEIREATRIRLDPKLLCRLFDFGILIDAAEAPPA